MKLLSNLGLLTAMVSVSLTSTADAQTPFLDDFDGYALGSVINGQNGWQQWDNVVNATSIIEDSTTGFARSGRSVSVNSTGAAGTPTSDLVHQFTGFTTGQHTLRAYTFAPTGMLDKWFFMVLNTYANLGPYLWSVVVELTPASGIWSAYHGTGTPVQGALILNQWVELRAQIDLTANTVEVFYNGVSTAPPYSWTAGYAGTDTGALNIACVDLYHNPLVTSPAGRAYWDDFGLTNGFPPPSPVVIGCGPNNNSQSCTPSIGSNGFSSASAPTGFNIVTTQVRYPKPALYLYSTNLTSVPFGFMTRCIGSPIARTVAFPNGDPLGGPLGMMTGGPAVPDCGGIFTVDMNRFRSFGYPATAYSPPTPAAYLSVQGTVVNAQYWGRDNGFASPNNFSLSDVLQFTVGN